ncbi:16S rRNA (adenine(1518)-N(6)/adenine(1519)-N(6))-dimethyltransferase RsmA [Polymorphobacter arshaanensis]|uniref:Ribosomal RNA small subunit methyltransferase A n=1 Tax=Glacieibacterium arshaanense TaxID=2511025 RepID=A0A4Y9EQB8_9SPHN|nr:16S rRNA (adenine(1518)-N(6)/adenine(1519)-N(6))-dimethyltransferase RsmA [Polymorphobacter arshaanensis]
MTDALLSLPPLREVIARHGLAAKKSLGQNFLLDGNLLDRIARVPGPLAGASVYEVGPGPGGLTRALLRAGANVVAVERDDRALPALAELGALAPGRLQVVGGDALDYDPRGTLPGPLHIVANLPYNIGTALLVRWLTIEPWPPWWASLTLMFQKEVAQRIVAAAGSDAYGRLSVLAQFRSRPRIAFDLPAKAFTPPPKVASAVVHIVPMDPVLDVPMARIEAVTAAAFGQRRKMLRASLKTLNGGIEALQRTGIDPERRAETLTVAEFAALAAEL